MIDATDMLLAGSLPALCAAGAVYARMSYPGLYWPSALRARLGVPQPMADAIATHLREERTP